MYVQDKAGEIVPDGSEDHAARCPFFGTDESGPICRALAEPTLVTDDWQNRYCLTANHTKCRRYRLAGTNPMETSEKSNPAASLALVAVFVALSAMLIAVAWNQLSGEDSNNGGSTAGQPSTPTAPASAVTPEKTPAAAATSPVETATAAAATATATTPAETPVAPTATSAAATTEIKTPTAETEETAEPTPTETATSEPTTPSQPETAATAWPPSLPTTHAVRPAETLNSIAQLYGVSLDLLRAANPIVDPAAPAVGTELLVPGPNGELPTSSQYERLHVVQPGETVMQIADLYGLTVADIAQANNLANPNVLSAGTMLLIPRTK